MMISFVSYHELLPIVMWLVTVVLVLVVVVFVTSYDDYGKSFPKSHHYYCDYDDDVVVVVTVYDWKTNVTWYLSI